MPGAAPLAVAVVVISLVVLVGWGVAGAVLDEPFRVFTKEPLEQFPDAPPYLGVLAGATWFLWMSAASAAVLAAWVLSCVAAGDRRIPFLLGAAALTLVLLADDFLMLHERLFPKLGLPEEAIYAIYAAGFSALLLRFRPQLREGGAILALAAGAAWACSLAADFAQEHIDIHAHAVEDGAKLIGTALWTAYLIRASILALVDTSPHAGGGGTPDAAEGADASST